MSRFKTAPTCATFGDHCEGRCFHCGTALRPILWKGQRLVFVSDKNKAEKYIVTSVKPIRGGVKLRAKKAENP